MYLTDEINHFCVYSNGKLQNLLEQAINDDRTYEEELHVIRKIPGPAHAWL